MRDGAAGGTDIKRETPGAYWSGVASWVRDHPLPTASLAFIALLGTAFTLSSAVFDAYSFFVGTVLPFSQSWYFPLVLSAMNVTLLVIFMVKSHNSLTRTATRLDTERMKAIAEVSADVKRTLAPFDAKLTTLSTFLIETENIGRLATSLERLDELLLQAKQQHTEALENVHVAAPSFADWVMRVEHPMHLMEISGISPQDIKRAYEIFPEEVERERIDPPGHPLSVNGGGTYRKIQASHRKLRHLIDQRQRQCKDELDLARSRSFKP